MYWILKDKEPVPCNIQQWGKMFKDADSRGVDKTTVGYVEVSTMFLGIDHRLGGEGPPVLFETMVFGGALDEEQVRYCTWDEAVAGHKLMVQRVSGTKGVT